MAPLFPRQLRDDPETKQTFKPEKLWPMLLSPAFMSGVETLQRAAAEVINVGGRFGRGLTLAF